MAGLRVVGDDFPAAAATLDVKLVEDGAPVLGRTNVMLLEKCLCGIFVKDSGKESGKGVFRGKHKRLSDDIHGKRAQILLRLFASLFRNS